MPNARDLSRVNDDVTGMYLGLAVEPLVMKKRRTGSAVRTFWAPLSTIRSMSAR